MISDFENTQRRTASEQEQLKTWFALILESTFSDKGHCLIALPPEAKPLFENWCDDYLLPCVAKDPTYDDYNGYADLTDGHFGIRVKDTPEIINQILAEMGILKHGINYFIMHDPNPQKIYSKKNNKTLEGPQNAP